MRTERVSGSLEIHTFGVGSMGILASCGVLEIVSFVASKIANFVIAGSGKTILAYLRLLTGLMVHRSIVVNYLEQTFFYDEDIAIACVYFDHKAVYEPVAILKSILKHVLHRILRKEGTISEEIRQFYKNHLREERKPSLSEISEMLLLELRRNFSEIFVVLKGTRWMNTVLMQIPGRSSCKNYKSCNRTYV